jgi:hypothetical protein
MQSSVILHFFFFSKFMSTHGKPQVSLFIENFVKYFLDISYKGCGGNEYCRNWEPHVNSKYKITLLSFEFPLMKPFQQFSCSLSCQPNKLPHNKSCDYVDVTVLRRCMASRSLDLAVTQHQNGQRREPHNLLQIGIDALAGYLLCPFLQPFSTTAAPSSFFFFIFHLMLHGRVLTYCCF